MLVLTRSLYFLSSIAISHAFTPSQLAPQTSSDSSATLVAYWSPITTLPPEPLSTSEAHLELRAGPAAPVAPVVAPVAPINGAPAPVAPAPKPPVAPVPAPVAPAPAPVVPGAAAPAGAAPAVGVGGAGAAPAAAQPASVNPAQVPSITTYQGTTYVGGVAKQVPIVYTQMFSSVPSQGPTPEAGAIGLGTLTGTVGAVRTSNAKGGAASQGGKGDIGTVVAGAIFMMLGAMIMGI